MRTTEPTKYGTAISLARSGRPEMTNTALEYSEHDAVVTAAELASSYYYRHSLNLIENRASQSSGNL